MVLNHYLVLHVLKSFKLNLNQERNSFVLNHYFVLHGFEMV